MSGQWETVGKKKEKTPVKSAPKTSNEKKKKPENFSVKLEDVLPKAQVRNLYAKEVKNDKNKPAEESEVKKPAIKKQQEKTAADNTKPKPPKSIESALKLIDADEFKLIFENSKSQFPDAPIVWLKELVQFLNQKVSIDVHDPVFSNKSLQYPLLLVPTEIKAVIENAIEEANKSNTQLFFDISLSSMATDMSKNLPALGHKIFLQYIARAEPELIVQNIEKHITLRNSYQNRPNIGLSILWAVGQSGYENLNAGLQVFENLMLPLLEMKNYSRFVIQYLINIIGNAKKEASITKEQYFLIMDTIYSNKKNFPNDLKEDLEEQQKTIKDLLFVKLKSEDINGLNDYFLPKIITNSNKTYQASICDVLVESLSLQTVYIEHWKKEYGKNVVATSVLLQHIDDNFDEVWVKAKNDFVGRLLLGIDEVNPELSSKKRKEEGLDDIERIMKSLSKKMAEKYVGPSLFMKFLIVFVLVTVYILYYLDAKRSPREPKYDTWLDNLPYDVLNYFLNIPKIGFLWIDDQLLQVYPGYHETVQFYTEPYIELGRNTGLTLYNIVMTVHEATFGKYVYFWEQMLDVHGPKFFNAVSTVYNHVWSAVAFYVNHVIHYLKTEIFVGQLSPENVQRILLEALNTTQTKATEYYHWVYEKVQTTVN